ncbi:MAG: nucleoside-diphosphate sugar epimerase/dehydratase, partial [bacterium]
AYFIRFEGLPSGMHLKQLCILIPYVVIARLLLFSIFRIYSIVWRYISISDSLVIFKANSLLTIFLLLGRGFLPSKLMLLKIPYSVIVLEFLLALLGTLGLRMLRRLLYEARERSELEKDQKEIIKNVLLIGAGAAGNVVAKELKQRPDLGYRIIGFIDDDPKKFKSTTQGLKVLGNTSQIKDLTRKYDVNTAIISIANASSQDIRRISEICKDANVKVKIVPGIFELLDDKIKINKIRDVNIDDLLGRSVVQFENSVPEILNKYREKRILVTGAGGSIGSELCLQLAVLWPKQLILLDKDENSIFEIHNELHADYENIKIVPVIADIRHIDRLKSIYQRFHPQVVFHAAAHKHVPLMEENITEAVTNNVKGTKNVAEMAIEFGVETFINISTDKAVNPTSVMGATKKIGEMIIQQIAEKSDTNFSCVRFGNVLGSRGSVVPFFQRQIANGGPVTITHPEVERFFMSISEAVQLIIKAGTLGKKGDVFVLDMGTPVKIADLAKDLIRLSGMKEDEIEIKYVGLRPGEKLYEEMLVDQERDKATNYQKIFIAPPGPIECEDFKECLDLLIQSANRCDGEAVIECFKKMRIGYIGERDIH